MLLLAKYHDIRLSERTLKRKLKDFGLKRREHVDENLEIRVRNIITEEVSARPDKLNGYRSMWSIHGCVDGFSRRVLWLQVNGQTKSQR